MKLLNKDEFIANEIKYWIEKEGLMEGDKIPSERELAELYGVQRGTIRAAFNILEEEGIIEIRNRSGRYIGHPRIIYNLAELKSFTEKVNDIGAEAGYKLIAIESVAGDSSECRKFDTRLEGDIHKITRLRYVIREGEQHAVAIEYSYIPAAIVPHWDGCDLERESLYLILTEQYGQKLVRQEQTVEIVYANKYEEELLHVSRLDPLVLKKGIIFNSAGKAVECIRSIMDKDWIEFVKNNQLIEEKVRGTFYEV